MKKKVYIMPRTEMVQFENERIMGNNSEPEVTYNIGAKEDFLAFDDYEDSFWGDDDE